MTDEEIRKNVIDGLCVIANPDRGFYNCDGCGWSGNKLIYVGFDYVRHVLASRLPRGTGVCPNCNREFNGCLHESVYDEIMTQRGSSNA